MKRSNLIVFGVLLITISVLFTGCTNIQKESETTTESTTVVATEETLAKKEDKTTKEATTEKQTEVETKETEATTKYVAPVETTKKQENTTKAVATTKAPKPVATTKPAPKPVATTKPAPKPTTTKAPKDEYYPALTAADMKTLEAYCKQYVESKGYTYDSSLNWDNCGYSSRVGITNDIDSYGDKYKVGKGESPLEWAKRDVRSAVNANIYDFGDRDWLTMAFLYEKTSNGWLWTVGYMA